MCTYENGTVRILRQGKELYRAKLDIRADDFAEQWAAYREAHWKVYQLWVADLEAETVLPDTDTHFRGKWVIGLFICDGCEAIAVGDKSLRPAYCSEDCATRAKWRRQAVKRKAARQLEPRDCEHCGESFQPTRSDAKFCGVRCRVANSRALAK